MRKKQARITELEAEIASLKGSLTRTETGIYCFAQDMPPSTEALLVIGEGRGTGGWKISAGVRHNSRSGNYFHWPSISFEVGQAFKFAFVWDNSTKEEAEMIHNLSCNQHGPYGECPHWSGTWCGWDEKQKVLWAIEPWITYKYPIRHPREWNEHHLVPLNQWE